MKIEGLLTVEAIRVELGRRLAQRQGTAPYPRDVGEKDIR